MSQDKSELKQPVGVYILAVLFMLAPIGNIILSFIASGVEGWYQPNIFLELLGTVPTADWIWLIAIFIAGFSLLMRHKSSWMTSVVVLLLVLGMNTYRAFTVDESALNPEFVRVQILVSILVTFSVLVIAFYTRYPYLDRRQQWIFPTAHRYNVATPVLVHIAEGVTGITESVSSAGVRIRMPKVVDELKHAEDLLITFSDMDSFKIATEIVEFNGTVLRLKFKKFGWGARGRLEAWLKSKST